MLDFFHNRSDLQAINIAKTSKIDVCFSEKKVLPLQ
jgi:hypothetical protein